MTPGERAELFAALPSWVQAKIDSEYAPCGYKDDIIEEVGSTIKESQRSGGSVNPKSPIIEWGLDYCIEKAHSDATRFERDVCHYLEMSLSPGKRWFRNYVLDQASVLSTL